MNLFSISYLKNLSPNGGDGQVQTEYLPEKKSLPPAGEANNGSTGNISQQLFYAKENFVRTMIHEIRNPLTAINLANQSLTEMIADGDNIQSSKIYTSIISKNVSRIEHLLRRLLDPGKGEQSDFIPTDICHVIDIALAKAEDRFFLQKIKVYKSYIPGYIINGNPEKLSRAFLNIIVNAVEAMTQDHGKLWIAVYQSKKDDIRIVIKDNGRGIEPEIVQKMFDENISCKPGGHGIGLHYVKEIMDLHHATISVSSEPGIGTTIVVLFKSYKRF